MRNAQFQKFIHSEVLKTSNYDQDAREAREDFKQYTHMEAQFFKDLIIQNIDSIEKLNSSLGNTKSSGFVSNNMNAHSSDNDCNKTRNAQRSEKKSITFGNKSSRSGNECSERRNSGNDTDIKPSYDTKPMAEVDSNITPDVTPRQGENARR
nr:hypothetical protein [Tanacetum cinerariifolium]